MIVGPPFFRTVFRSVVPPDGFSELVGSSAQDCGCPRARLGQLVALGDLARDCGDRLVPVGRLYRFRLCRRVFVGSSI